MIKTLRKIGMQGIFLNLLKGVSKKSIVNNFIVKDWMLFS